MMKSLALRSLWSIAIGIGALALAYLAGFIFTAFWNPVVLAVVFVLAAGLGMRQRP